MRVIPENINPKPYSTKPSLRGFVHRVRVNISGITRTKQLVYGLLPGFMITV